MSNAAQHQIVHDGPPIADSPMKRLRAATWPAHQALERHVDVHTRFAQRVAYREHLEKLWGFCMPLDLQLKPALLETALPDYGARRKAPALERDLIALGLTATQVARLPRCERLPTLTDTASALGSLYVLEGASLGGRTLLPVVSARLGVDAEHGAAFLASYGDEVGSMWKRFGAAVNAWCAPPDRGARALASAVATFEALRAWL